MQDLCLSVAVIPFMLAVLALEMRNYRFLGMGVDPVSSKIWKEVTQFFFS